MLYALEWLFVLVAASASPYLGFVGFFWVTALSGVATAVALLSKYNSFFGSGVAASFETAAVAKVGYSQVSVALYVDSVGYAFGLLTALIGSAVYFYAFSYMRLEKNILNFLIYLEVFKLSMMLLVWANSWFTLVLGWELIGASSFLLINFWTSKATTLKSAFKALSFNKLSDAALITAACIALWFGASTVQSAAHFGAVLAEKSASIGHLTVSANDAFLVCICVASFCKSAQLGFHFWLPDSMEAPVPASALIHSATLVSAGIYLVSRFSFCFLNSPTLLQFFQLLTAATAFYGAAVAAFQTDVKKILAYSTISHCGMLMYSITLFRPEITLFYLFAHGFFKSLNFLCVGNFVQYANNYQDVSRMGGFGSAYRLEAFFLFVTAFNLSSAPLFLAFFSKHWLITSAAYSSPHSSITSALLFAAAYCGFFYSAKLYNETVLSKKRAHRTIYNTKAVRPATLRWVRRANNLGLVGMLLLFVYAAAILAMLFAQITAGGSWRSDVWSGSSAPLPTLFEGTLLLGFSLTLTILAYSYVAFKRSGNRLTPLIVALAVFSLIISI